MGFFFWKVLFFFVFELYVSYIHIFQSLLTPFVILNIFCYRRPLSQNLPSFCSNPNQVALLVVIFLDCFIYIYFFPPQPPLFLAFHDLLCLYWVNTIKKKPQGEYQLKYSMHLFLVYIIVLEAWTCLWESLFHILFQRLRLMEVMISSICAFSAIYSSVKSAG